MKTVLRVAQQEYQRFAHLHRLLPLTFILFSEAGLQFRNGKQSRYVTGY